MVFPVIGGDGKPTGYDISNSLRFNDGDSPSLQFTPSSAGNEKTWTVSFWVKRGVMGTSSSQMIFASDTNYGEYVFCRFCGTEVTGKTDMFQVFMVEPNAREGNVRTTRLFRDPSAWYHIVVRCDLTQGTAADRLRIYVNGVKETSFDTASYLNQNDDNVNWNSNVPQAIGHQKQASSVERHLDGYISEFYNIDGSSLGPDSFGETNDNGVWIPKDAKNDLTFGTNGYYLQFKQTGTSANSSGIGADTSGNDHHWTPANLAATDVTVDTPTNNFATLIPALNTALSEGNTKLVTTRQSNWDGVHSSIGVTSGKWYFEVKASLSDDSFRIGAGVAGDPETFPKIFNGLGDNGDPMNTFSNTYPFYGKGVWLDHWYDQNYDDSSTASTQSSGDILQFALDMDNYKLWVGVNGQFKDNSNNNVSYSDVASGNSPTVTIASAAYTGKTFFPGILIRDDQDADDNVAEINFGNPSFSISSGNTDGLYGNFEYAVPSGYYALCTKRLAEYG